MVLWVSSMGNLGQKGYGLVGRDMYKRHDMEAEQVREPTAIVGVQVNAKIWDRCRDLFALDECQ